MVCSSGGITPALIDGWFDVRGVNCAGGVRVDMKIQGDATAEDSTFYINTLYGDGGQLSGCIKFPLITWSGMHLITTGTAYTCLSAHAALSGGTQGALTYSSGGWINNDPEGLITSQYYPLVSLDTTNSTVIVTAFVGGQTITSSGAEVVINSQDDTCVTSNYGISSPVGNTYYASFSVEKESCTSWCGASGALTYYTGGSYWINSASAYVSGAIADGAAIDYIAGELVMSYAEVSNIVVSENNLPTNWTASPYVDDTANVVTLLTPGLFGGLLKVPGNNFNIQYASCGTEDNCEDATGNWESSTVTGRIEVTSENHSQYVYTYDDTAGSWIAPQGAPTIPYSGAITPDNNGGVLVELLSSGTVVASASGTPVASLTYQPASSGNVAPIGSAVTALDYYELVGSAVCVASGGSSSGGPTPPPVPEITSGAYIYTWGIADATGKSLATVYFREDDPSHGDIIDNNGQYAGCVIGRKQLYTGSSYLSGGNLGVFMQGLPRRYELNPDTLVLDICRCAVLPPYSAIATNMSSIQLPPDCKLSIDANNYYYLAPKDDDVIDVSIPLKTLTFTDTSGGSVTLAGSHPSVTPYCVSNFSAPSVSGGQATITITSRCGIEDIVVTQVDGAIVIATHGGLHRYE